MDDISEHIIKVLLLDTRYHIIKDVINCRAYNKRRKEERRE